MSSLPLWRGALDGFDASGIYPHFDGMMKSAMLSLGSISSFISSFSSLRELLFTDLHPSWGLDSLVPSQTAAPSCADRSVASPSFFAPRQHRSAASGGRCTLRPHTLAPSLSPFAIALLLLRSSCAIPSLRSYMEADPDEFPMNFADRTPINL